MSRMVEIFRAQKMPLCLAVVPGWLSPPRWELLRIQTGTSKQWCWHQHGWQHKNYQSQGKKSEFGEERTALKKSHDILRGRHKLETLMGKDFQPFFTPPWNRFDAATATLLSSMDWKGVSRSLGAQKKVPLPKSLPDIPIAVDLHTRTEATNTQCWEALLAELHRALQKKQCGIMLHHQRTNKTALDFLDFLLQKIRRHPRIHPVTFADLL